VFTTNSRIECKVVKGMGRVPRECFVLEDGSHLLPKGIFFIKRIQGMLLKFSHYNWSASSALFHVFVKNEPRTFHLLSAFNLSCSYHRNIYKYFYEVLPPTIIRQYMSCVKNKRPYLYSRSLHLVLSSW